MQRYVAEFGSALVELVSSTLLRDSVGFRLCVRAGFECEGRARWQFYQGLREDLGVGQGVLWRVCGSVWRRWRGLTICSLLSKVFLFEW
jgi:hypothetical protein